MGNFEFLARRDTTLAELGRRAEAYALNDPNTSLIKLRQFLERLVVVLADIHRSGFAADSGLLERLKYAERVGWLERAASAYAHQLRRAGNRAVHELETSVGRAVEQLRNARRLAIWFEATFGDPEFRPGRFLSPARPPDASTELDAALARQAELEAALEETLAAGTEERAALQAELEEKARLLARPDVVLDATLAAAVDALPASDRDSAREGLRAFRDEANPEALEEFSDTSIDRAFRWMPLTDEHALVVAVAPDEALLLALWVGDVGAAPAWVRRHRVQVHLTTGHLQVFATDAPVAGSGTLFADLSDDDLLACGVPPLLLPAVRALSDEVALRGLTEFLPEDASEILLGVLDGLNTSDARATAGLVPPRPDVPIDPADFSTALGHPASRRRFVEVVDDEALAAVLDAPLAAWRTFLHPSQHRIVKVRANGPVRVLGGAGTGKTVALLHRAVLLARERHNGPDDRLLITTFTRNLAGELRALLDDLAPDIAGRIEVEPLHRFARRLLVREGHRIPEVISDSARRRLMAQAAATQDSSGSFSLQFLLDEWRSVILRFGLRGRDDYLRHPRVGRGTRLGRRKRALAWRIFAAAQEAMEAEGLGEAVDLVHRATRLLKTTPRLQTHCAVLADEVQDFGADALRLLRAAAPSGPDDLFLVGDGHQRLYGAPVALSSCGIRVRGRAFRLRLNYRTTESIRRLAHTALGEHVADDLDGGKDSLTGYRSLRTGQPPRWLWNEDRSASHESLADVVDGWSQEIDPASICVAARTRAEVAALSLALRNRSLDVCPLDGPPRPGVRLSTFHRLKGTEFTRVALSSVCAGGLAEPSPSERCLLYVAATRARDVLLIAGWGTPSPLLAPHTDLEETS